MFCLWASGLLHILIWCVLPMDESIEIIGTESLGVRGLCCLVTTGERRIMIDPGVALGYIRHGLLPHPLQVATGERVRQRIIEKLNNATDVVFSHFHGDHIPLRDANPYQLAISQLPLHFQNICCWSKSIGDSSDKMKQRSQDLKEILGDNFHMAEGLSDGPMCFSRAMPHGIQGSRQGTVMMTRINVGDKVFVHASDIQLLDAEPIDNILAWQPDIVLASGPPLYLERLTEKLQTVARKNALRLADSVDTLILDHHLMRDDHGLAWLKDISREVGRKVCCAAEFMGRKPQLLEAERTKLYEAYPVPPHWHEEYAAGCTTAYIAI